MGGVPVLLVQGDREDVVAVPEDALGAVCHVHVPVDDRHALDATGAGVLDPARHVVEIRRGDRSVGLGMVSGRSSVDERPLDAAVEDRVDRGQHAADGQPGRLPGGRRDRCVLAVPRPARAGRAEAAKVRRRVDREQRLVGRRDGLDAREPAAQRAALHEVVRLRGQHGLGDVRAAQREVPARDLHRRGRRIVGEDTGRVGVAQHDAAILTIPRLNASHDSPWRLGLSLGPLTRGSPGVRGAPLSDCADQLEDGRSELCRCPEGVDASIALASRDKRHSCAHRRVVVAVPRNLFGTRMG